MKIAFFGTPEFASDILRNLLQKHEISCVVTAEDKRRGRGKKIVPSPVKELALENGIPVLQPQSLKNEDFKKELSVYEFDLAVVVAYGKIIPQKILDMATYGFLNVHASLLPRWRGAAPIQRAIMAGDKETGISIMKMDSGLDTGAVYSMVKVKIEDNDTTGTLFKKLTLVGSEELLKVISNITDPDVKPIPQSDVGVTYAHKIDKSMCGIDWSLSCYEILCLIRGLNPYPCAKTSYNGEMWKIFMADCLSERHDETFGKVVSADEIGIKVACRDGYLIIKELQKSGSKKMPVSEFLRGKNVEAGIILC